MQIFWEASDWPGAYVEPGVTALSWTPEPAPTDCSEESCENKETKKATADRTLTYAAKSGLLNAKTGLLGAGSKCGSVGITRTELNGETYENCHETATDLPSCLHNWAWNDGAPEIRHNFNLRGHQNAISLVSWNRVQTKMATCDETGVVYVWVPYEERWSVELVNDRGVKVRDFAWSPNGNSALICYEDNFVLIGSSGGQRIWSNTYAAQTMNCGAWSPDSRHVVLGTAAGNLNILSEQGTAIGEHIVRAEHAILKLTWSATRSDGNSTLCVLFEKGCVYLLRCFDDPDPAVVETGLTAVVTVQWTSDGQYLAVVGYLGEGAGRKNRILVYNPAGANLLACDVPFSPEQTVTAFTWTHGGRGLVVAAGPEVRSGRVLSCVGRLRALASYRVWTAVGRRCVDDGRLDALPLPRREMHMVKAHNAHMVQCRVPTEAEMREAVCRPSDWRWYCTIRPVPRKTQTYTLCMEHMGGLVAVLIGRQTHRILPEFEIRITRPPRSGHRSKSRDRSHTPEPSPPVETAANSSAVHSTGDVPVESGALQRGNFQRNSVWRRSKRQLQAIMQRAHQPATPSFDSLIKQEQRLVQVSSNVWCTRFKLLGAFADMLPPYLGQVSYKTSVLHLQPRQMTVQVVDLTSAAALLTPVAPPADDDGNPDGADEWLLAGHAADAGPPVAPTDGELFVGAAAAAIHRQRATATSQATSDDDALALEQVRLQQVYDEFGELRAAVDRHIRRMKDFAVELQRSSQQLHTTTTNSPTSTSTQRVERVAVAEEVHSAARADEAGRMAAAAGQQVVKRQAEQISLVEEESKPPAVECWERQLAAMEFIDEDEELVITCDREKDRLRPRALSTGERREPPPPLSGAFSYATPGRRSERFDGRRKASGNKQRSVAAHVAQLFGSARHTHDVDSASSSADLSTAFASPPSRQPSMTSGRANSKQLNEITSVLDKLYKLANDLTARPGIADGGAAASLTPLQHQTGMGKVAPQPKQPPPAPLAADDQGGFWQLRSRVRDIAGRVSQLERRINHGNELLDEVRADLQRRVQNIRSVVDGCDLVDAAAAAAAAASKESKESKAVLCMQNKTPFWNEQSQVYQLDFGGRVTQESAKNFQIEHRERQVMQFGRIENGSYTLDFRAPFTAVQAFAIALASITQRLK